MVALHLCFAYPCIVKHIFELIQYVIMKGVDAKLRFFSHKECSWKISLTKNIFQLLSIINHLHLFIWDYFKKLDILQENVTINTANVMRFSRSN